MSISLEVIVFFDFPTAMMLFWFFNAWPQNLYLQSRDSAGIRGEDGRAQVASQQGV